MIDMTNNKIPFGLLSEEDQQHLRNWSHKVEVWDFETEQWINAKTPMWFDGAVYRTVPAPLTKPWIDWSHVAKELRTDSGGKSFLYTDLPRISGHSYIDGGCVVNAARFASYDPGTCDWKDSLVERPEGV